MIAKGSQEERRKYPRIKGNIPVKLCQEDGDIVTETGNISGAGSYCRVDEHIQLMTKLEIHLLIPTRKNGKNINKKITCHGVVVRSEPIPKEKGYNVAIFFNDISQKDAESINDYVNSTLEEA
jgi:hypothetical protein